MGRKPAPCWIKRPQAPITPLHAQKHAAAAQVGIPLGLQTTVVCLACLACKTTAPSTCPFQPEGCYCSPFTPALSVLDAVLLKKCRQNVHPRCGSSATAADYGSRYSTMTDYHTPPPQSMHLLLTCFPCSAQPTAHTAPQTSR